MRSWICAAAVALAGAQAEPLSRTVASMDRLNGLEVSGPAEVVPEGPGGRRAVRTDGTLEMRIDLAAAGVDARAYDLIKLDVKADRGASLVVSLENWPGKNQLTHWYVLDTARAAFDWRTIWIDLRRPEEVKEAGTYKGMAEARPDARGLRLRAFVKDLGRKEQGPGRRVWLGPVRFVRQAVHLDWDQRQAPHAIDAAGHIAFRYPLTVTNRLDRPIQAKLDLLPFDVRRASATLSSNVVALEPRQTRIVEATVTLPSGTAALTTEFFEARARAEGIEDSEVTILRSSDPLHLTATAPVDEKRLTFPLLGRRRDLPDAVTGFDPQKARAAAEGAGPGDLDVALDGPLDLGRPNRGFNYWGRPDAEWHRAGWRYLDGLTACAFLYDFTGEKRYLEKGTAMLLRAAELFRPRLEEWRQIPGSPISHGILAMNTLALGWSTGGMRPPYLYERHGIFNAFDLLAADMPADARKKIIDGFILPAAIHMRNHYFGLSNQQDVVNAPILYAGLAARNWPLAAFAVGSEHGVVGQIRWAFNDDGLAGEGNYHMPSIDPILHSAELLRRAGINLYDPRLREIIHSRGAEAIGKSYRRSIVPFLDEHRFGKETPTAGKPAGGMHLDTGLTLLRRDGLEVAMNWDMQINRGAPDRCALRIQARERHPLHGVGGGNYTHSSLGQSIIIVDEERQDPQPAEVLGHDVEGAVQFVQARSDRHYPGTTITRTFALLGEHVVVMDRVWSDRPRTVDWCLRYTGVVEDVAKAVQPPMTHQDGSFTAKPDDKARGVIFGAKLKSQGHFEATVDGMWRQAKGSLVMAAAPGTRVYVFAVPAAFSASQKERQTGVPVLMVRRLGVKRTDFLAALSPKVKGIEQVGATKAGGPADALGAIVTFEDGTACRAVVNFEPPGVEVRVGPLVTTDRFATDFR